MSGIRSAKAMMALFSLFLLIVCTATVVSANGDLLCSTGSKETREAEGDIEFLSASVNNKVGECWVTIYYPQHDEIELTLVNVSKTYPCEEDDYIEIYSQYRTRLVARYCIGDGGLADGNKETLRLKINAVMIRRYYKVSPSNELLPEIATKVRVHYRKMRPCRHTLSAETGALRWLRSPSYPDFSWNSECEWRIYTHGGATIQLTFHNVELSANCNGSFIEVIDNERTQICGKHLTKTIQSKSSELVIRMKSTTDSAVRFKATYKEIPKCRIVELKGPAEFRYPKGELCVKWVLTAFLGQIAALSFSQTNLDSTSAKSCSGDVVEVWDGDSTKVYCNSNVPPVIIRSLNGHSLTVTYRRTGPWDASSYFYASFTSVSLAKYNAKCFVQNMALYFRCSQNDLLPISCDFLCDGAVQCPDNSDEDSCDQDNRWHKLQVFVIVMGSICASTVTFCVGVVCFRKFTSQTGSISDSYGRQLSTSDQATITPNVDLPSPPPRYFNNNENNPPSVIRGTYFFGNEFSQSGIHSAFLFGIPPPRYRSTESLHPLCADGNHGDGQWQGEMTNMASRQTSVCGDETQSNLQQGEQFVSGVSSGDVNSTATEAVPLVHCCSVTDEGKENKKLPDSGIENQEVDQQINESTQAAATTESNGTSISHSDAFNPMYV